jgi:hypothetical protein
MKAEESLIPELLPEEVELEKPPQEAVEAAQRETQPAEERPTVMSLIVAGKFDAVRERFAEEAQEAFVNHVDVTSRFHCMALFEPLDSIDQYDLDRVFRSLKTGNPNRAKNVLLLLLSTGGRIEPAYQISKLCKSFSKTSFVVVVPRQAKSAATLICLGADEIHMGPLGHLGPIDPQLGSLPALGVNQALHTIAAVSEKYPRSADMFARYLRSALTVEQIGYCDRIGESAVQYATRLLSNKPPLREKALDIAKELVHEYKDHGFVIDVDEAKQHLGAEWIKEDTAELKFAEDLYSLFESYNFMLGYIKEHKLLIIGDPTNKDELIIGKIRK